MLVSTSGKAITKTTRGAGWSNMTKYLNLIKKKYHRKKSCYFFNYVFFSCDLLSSTFLSAIVLTHESHLLKCLTIALLLLTLDQRNS